MTIAVPDHTGDHPSTSASWFTTERQTATPTPRQDLTVVGSTWGPQILPDQLVTVRSSSVSYQDLFSDVDPSGMPARAMARGTYIPPVTGALKVGY